MQTQSGSEQDFFSYIESLMNRTIYTFVFILIAFSCLGCNKKDPEFSELPPSVNLRNTNQEIDEIQRKITEFLKYSKYPEKRIGEVVCYINEENHTCVKVTSIVKNKENNKQFIYVVQTRYDLDLDYKIVTSRIGGGGELTLMKFELAKDAIILTSKSEPILCNIYGYPCEPKTYRVGSSNELGWVMESMTMLGGNAETILSIYFSMGIEIKQVLTLPTTESFTCNDEKKEDAEECRSIKDVSIKTVPEKDVKYFDLKIEIEDALYEGEKDARILKKYTNQIKYNSNINSYDFTEVSKVIKDF